MTTSPGVSLEDVRNWPAVVDLVTAARALGLGRSAAYELHRRGELPFPVLRLGRFLRVPSAAVLALLDPRNAEVGAHTPALADPLRRPSLGSRDAV